MAKMMDLNEIWKKDAEATFTDEEREVLFPLWRTQSDIREATANYIEECKRAADAATDAARKALDHGATYDAKWVQCSAERLLELHATIEKTREQQRALLHMLKAANLGLFNRITITEPGQ